MKKTIFLTLAMTLIFGAAQFSKATPPRTSASLNTDSSLTTDIDKAGNLSVPVGTVIAWPYKNLPTDGDWKLCNGQVIAIKDYPEFYEKFGTNKLPNFQGMFLRGYGSQGFSQINGSLNGLTTTIYKSGYLNEIQGDAIRPIKGDLKRGISGDAPEGAFHLYATKGNGVVHNSNRSRWMELDVSRVTPTANEIRPVNMAVHYIIKVR